MEEYRLQLINKVKEFKKLESNWNCYQAEPFTDKVIERTINFIKELNPIGSFQVSPTARNSIQLEWDSADSYIEIEIFEDKIEIDKGSYE